MISVTGKWYNKCIDIIELKSILGSVGKYSYNEYVKKLNLYFKREIKKYDDDIKCIVPLTNIPNNIFEHIKDNNFKIYRMLDDVYYELYEYTTLATVEVAAVAEVAAAAAVAPAAIYTNYLLDDFYTLHKIEDIPKKVEKQVLYPNYSSLRHMEQRLKMLSLIIYNSDDILNNLIFALKINTIYNIDKFLDRHMKNNTANLILPYDTYTLLDIFIISNEFNNYSYLESYDFFYSDYNMNTDIYTLDYYDNKTDNIFIENINTQIYENKKY
jgi:hypothetical protein